jgi:tRNA1(Val) A37 N6-methylase TrmN6
MSRVYKHDLLAYDGLKIFQRDDVFKFSLDSLLLGDFVKFKLRDKSVLELGCGVGPVLMYLTHKTSIKLYGIDIQEESINLAKQSIEYNKLQDQIEVFHMDILKAHLHFTPSSFDILICNPPFYKVNDRSITNKNENKSISRHEINLNFQDILSAGSKLLKTNGGLFLIHRANRIDEIVYKLISTNYVVKRLRFVYTKPNKEALMVLIEARYNGKTGQVKIEEPLYIYDKSNQYTKEVSMIFHLGDESFGK